MNIAIEDEIHHLSLAQPVFPLEIFQLIITEFATDSTKTAIKSCSLVCKAFLPFCRPFIFQGFEFGPVGPPNENQHRLQKFLQECPHLAQYFQDVTFSVDHEDMEGHNTAMQQVFAQQAQASYVEAYFDRVMAGGDPTLIYTLTNLKTLRIVHEGGTPPSDWEEDHTWNDICDAAIYRVLKVYLSSQTLTNLHIHNAGAIPMFIVMSIPNLRHLEFHDVDCTGWTSPSSEASPRAELPRHIPKLETLVLHSVINFPGLTLTFCKALRVIHGYYVTFNKSIPNFLDNSCRSAAFNNLHTLHLTSVHEWVPLCAMAEEIDLIAFPAVKNLCICPGDEDEHPAVNPFLNHFQALESLRIEVLVYSNEASSLIHLQKCFENCRGTLKDISLDWSLHFFYDESFMQVLNDALDFVSGQNVIETINIHLSLEWLFKPKPLDDPLFKQWRRFSALLVEDTQRDFPMLKRVGVWQTNQLCMALRASGVETWVDKDFLSVPLESLHMNTSGIDCFYHVRRR